MQRFSKYLPLAFFAAFLMLGLAAFFEGKPSHKNERIYSFVKPYSPYYLEKRFGGLEIRKKGDPDFKEKPTNETLFREFERLEKEWGQKHLRIENRTLHIVDDALRTKASLPIENEEETRFLKTYYGVTP